MAVRISGSTGSSGDTLSTSVLAVPVVSPTPVANPLGVGVGVVWVSPVVVLPCSPASSVPTSGLTPSLAVSVVPLPSSTCRFFSSNLLFTVFLTRVSNLFISSGDGFALTSSVAVAGNFSCNLFIASDGVSFLFIFMPFSVNILLRFPVKKAGIF